MIPQIENYLPVSTLFDRQDQIMENCQGEVFSIIVLIAKINRKLERLAQAAEMFIFA